MSIPYNKSHIKLDYRQYIILLVDTLYIEEATLGNFGGYTNLFAGGGTYNRAIWGGCWLYIFD